MEDLDLPRATRILGFGATVFVSDDFAQTLCAKPVPYRLASLLTEYDPRCKAILDEPRIAEANAAAELNLAIIQKGWNAPMIEATPLIGVRLTQIFTQLHRGYRMKTIFSEPLGSIELNWDLNGGFRILDDYQHWFLEASEVLPPAEEYPYLVWASRGESPITTIPGIMFQTPAPRLFFSPRQKSVFLAAAGGLQNARIAETLKLRPQSVQNAFRLAYRKIGSTPDLERMVFEQDQVSPQERRTRLLRFLEKFPEELRPWKSSRAPARVRKARSAH